MWKGNYRHAGRKGVMPPIHGNFGVVYSVEDRTFATSLKLQFSSKRGSAEDVYWAAEIRTHHASQAATSNYFSKDLARTQIYEVKKDSRESWYHK